MEKVIRNFLEIKSLNELSEIDKPIDSAYVKLLIPKDFQLNKFLYKQIGKKYCWTDRLDWSDQQWIKYVSQKYLHTYILKVNDDIAGFFELTYHKEKLESEIVYLGLLENFFGKKLGDKYCQIIASSLVGISAILYFLRSNINMLSQKKL